MKRLLAFLLLLLMLPVSSLAASKPKPTATPAPLLLSEELQEPPEDISHMLDIAYADWEELDGKKLPKSNKYTKWWNNYEWGWCAGYTTWCMLEAGIPTELEDEILKQPEGSVEGSFCVRGSSPAKYEHAFMHMNRTTMVPRKGFVVQYGKKGKNEKWHVGLVWDVQPLGEGRYRLTTLEGNVNSTVMMFVRDYDMNHMDSKGRRFGNISLVPEEEQQESDRKAFSYKYTYNDKDIYIARFLMTWIPEEPQE